MAYLTLWLEMHGFRRLMRVNSASERGLQLYLAYGLALAIGLHLAHAGFVALR